MSGVLLYTRYTLPMNSIDKLTEKLYKEYYEGVPWHMLVDEGACRSIGKAITKTINSITEMQNSGPLIAPVRGMNMAKKEALIRLSIDVAMRGIELMLKEAADN